jgi:hypothetical protein
MKRALLSAMVLGILSTSTATAQHARISAGYGRMLPTGDYSSTDQGGWQLMGAVEVTVPHTPLGLRLDQMYGGSRGRTSFDVGTFNVSVVTTSVVCHIGSPAAPLRPYLLAGVGYSVLEPEWDFAFTGGGGLSVGAGPWKAFVEGRVISAGNAGSTQTPLTFVAITGGLSFGL